MPFIRTILPAEAEGKLQEIYQHELQTQGYIANGTMTLSLRPEVFEAWEHLLKTIRSKMRLRRFELVTIAASGALHCTY